MAAEPREDPLDDIADFGFFPKNLEDLDVPDPTTPGVENPHLLESLLDSMAAEESRNFLNAADEIDEEISAKENSQDPLSRSLDNSPDLDNFEQRGPTLQRGPSQLRTTSESNDDDQFEPEHRVNSTASGNLRPEADRLRSMNFERSDENVEIQQNEAKKRKVPTFDPVSKVRRHNLIMNKRTSELASEEGRRTRRKVIPPLKHWLGQGYTYDLCPGMPPKVVGWKEVSFEEADNVYEWEELRFED